MIEDQLLAEKKKSFFAISSLFPITNTLISSSFISGT